MKNILISTGGSGGHVVPAKILREHLQSNYNVFISTDSRGLKYLDEKKNDIILINTPKLNFGVFIKTISFFLSSRYFNPLKSVEIKILKFDCKCSRRIFAGTTCPPDPPVEIKIFFI